MVNMEIERKFLVTGDEWRSQAEGIHCRQGYLSTDKESVIRIRTSNNSGLLTIKSPVSALSRLEYEYEIPLAEAEEILKNVCVQPLIEKKRYKILLNNLLWEVDEFYGANEGLIVAELELASEEERFEKPAWLGEEVSHDPRYFNVNLIARPFTTWNISMEERK
jgi:adenylate cyclase